MMRAQDVAEFFIQIANSSESEDDQITNLKLNKLLYFAQGAHLARIGTPLFDDPIEAWPFGPVVVDVYHRYKSFGKSPILANTNDFNDLNFSKDELEVLTDVIREFGQYTGTKLVSLTHQPNSPWSNANNTSEKVLSVDDIRYYFEKHPVPYLKDRLNIPVVNSLPFEWYDSAEDAEWEAYL